MKSKAQHSIGKANRKLKHTYAENCSLPGRKVFCKLTVVFLLIVIEHTFSLMLLVPIGIAAETGSQFEFANWELLIITFCHQAIVWQPPTCAEDIFVYCCSLDQARSMIVSGC